MTILILFVYAGFWAQGDSVSLTSQEFSTAAKCEAAGRAAKQLASGTKKDIRYVCVEK